MTEITPELVQKVRAYLVQSDQPDLAQRLVDVIDLHVPERYNGWGRKLAHICRHCSTRDHNGTGWARPVEYPCRTTTALVAPFAELVS